MDTHFVEGLRTRVRRKRPSLSKVCVHLFQSGILISWQYWPSRANSRARKYETKKQAIAGIRNRNGMLPVLSNSMAVAARSADPRSTKSFMVLTPNAQDQRNERKSSIAE
jgi:hypothetical protein